MLAETRDGRRGRDAAIAAARHHQMVVSAKLDRRRRPARIAKLFDAAGRTLRAASDIMFRDVEPSKSRLTDVIAQLRPEIGGDRLRDLDSGEFEAAPSERIRASGDKVRQRACLRSSSALTSRLRFMRSARQVQQALWPGLNTGPTSGKMPEGCTSDPRRAFCQKLPV